MAGNHAFADRCLILLSLEYLAELAQRHQAALKAPVQAFTLRGRWFAPWPDVSLMGVVNLSHDSWYRESVVLTVEAAIRRGRRLAIEGAAIVDVGAESTILDAARVDPLTQRARLLPIVRELAGSNVLVSVETYDTAIADSALRAGAAVLNLTAGAGTEPFYRLAADNDAGVVICFVAGANVREGAALSIDEQGAELVYDYLARETERAAACGVRAIWIDPGLGFYYSNLADGAERVRYQMLSLLGSFRLRTLGWPICNALPHAFEAFEEEVRSAEPFFAVMALLGQSDLLRTHEIAKVRGVVSALSLLR